MSETNLSLLDHERGPIQVSSGETYSITPEEELELGGYGVPDRHTPVIRQELLASVVEQGIDPESVVFSGYDPDIPKGEAGDDITGSPAEEIENQLKIVTKRANLLHARGHFDTNPEARQEYADKVAKLKAQRQDLEGYHRFDFNDAIGLSASKSDMVNPIHFAGTGEHATIGVYDRRLLRELDPESPAIDQGGVWTVHTTPEDMQRAELMQFHPRFMLAEVA